ncbi:MAG: radical SAM protein [Candidatus Methanoperedens sp.]|nr:radical SAM protein [Candidatus Methanoperedens sp.]
MNKLKVLLINPPIKPKEPPYNIPLGLISIAAVINSDGHDVAIFDNNAYKLKHEEVIGQINDTIWDIIGIGNLVTTYRWQKRMFTLLRNEFPNTILLAGGGLATSLQYDLMQWVPEIDILSIGEGERTIHQILENFEDKNWGNVRGIYYRENEKIHSTPPQQLLSEEELSNLPFPMYELLPLEEVYFKHSGIPLSPEAMVSKRRLSIESSRGCPFSCSFCIDLPTGTPRNLSHKRKLRYYNPRRTVELIKYLRLKYAIDFITFSDENFTVNKKYVLEFCDLMEKGGLTDLEPPLHFGTTAHVNTLDREILDKLKNAGCSCLDIGAESMNADILSKDIIKNSTPLKNEWAFNECLKAGIYPITNFIIGLPNENMQSIYDTTKFLVDNDIECGPFFVTPYPRTGLFERFRERIIKDFVSIEKFVIKCEDDVSRDFVINLTKYNDAELLGIRQMIINHDLAQIIKFASQKGEKVVEKQ